MEETLFMFMDGGDIVHEETLFMCGGDIVHVMEETLFM